MMNISASEEQVDTSQYILANGTLNETQQASFMSAVGDDDTTQYYSMLGTSSEAGDLDETLQQEHGESSAVQQEPNLSDMSAGGSAPLDSITLYQRGEGNQVFAVQVAPDETGALQKYNYQLRCIETGHWEAISETITVTPYEGEEIIGSEVIPDIGPLDNELLSHMAEEDGSIEDEIPVNYVDTSKPSIDNNDRSSEEACETDPLLVKPSEQINIDCITGTKTAPKPRKSQVKGAVVQPVPIMVNHVPRYSLVTAPNQSQITGQPFVLKAVPNVVPTASNAELLSKIISAVLPNPGQPVNIKRILVEHKNNVANAATASINTTVAIPPQLSPISNPRSVLKPPPPLSLMSVKPSVAVVKKKPDLAPIRTVPKPMVHAIRKQTPGINMMVTSIQNPTIIHAPVRQIRPPRKQTIQPVKRLGEEIVVREMMVSSQVNTEHGATSDGQQSTSSSSTIKPPAPKPSQHRVAASTPAGRPHNTPKSDSDSDFTPYGRPGTVKRKRKYRKRKSSSTSASAAVTESATTSGPSEDDDAGSDVNAKDSDDKKPVAGVFMESEICKLEFVEDDSDNIVYIDEDYGDDEDDDGGAVETIFIVSPSARLGKRRNSTVWEEVGKIPLAVKPTSATTTVPQSTTTVSPSGKRRGRPPKILAPSAAGAQSEVRTKQSAATGEPAKIGSCKQDEMVCPSTDTTSAGTHSNGGGDGVKNESELDTESSESQSPPSLTTTKFGKLSLQTNSPSSAARQNPTKSTAPPSSTSRANSTQPTNTNRRIASVQIATTSSSSIVGKTNKPSAHECRLCHRKFRSEPLLKAHQRTHTKASLAMRTNTTQQRVSPRRRLTRVSYIPAPRDADAAHSQTQTVKKVSPSTKRGSVAPTTVVGTTAHQCSVCTQKFTSGILLAAHMRRHTRFTCATCAQTFESKLLLDTHARRDCVKPKSPIVLLRRSPLIRSRPIAASTTTVSTASVSGRLLRNRPASTSNIASSRLALDKATPSTPATSTTVARKTPSVTQSAKSSVGPPASKVTPSWARKRPREFSGIPPNKKMQVAMLNLREKLISIENAKE